MFKGLGNLGDLAGLLKEAGKMKEKMAVLREELGQREVEGSAGGGMVTAKANGCQEILVIEIDDEVFESHDKALIQDLAVAAANAALENSKTMVREELAKITGGLGIDLPGIM